MLKTSLISSLLMSVTEAVQMMRAPGELFLSTSTAVQLGLTATPKERTLIPMITSGSPFNYSLKDGINDGFLTPSRLGKLLAQWTTTFEEIDNLVKGTMVPGTVVP